MILTENLKENIKNHALKEVPNEACGLIFFDEKTNLIDTYPCNNISNQKKHCFTISPHEYLLIISKGKILGSYHSQIDSDQFSELDKRNSYHHNIIFYMYCVNKNSFHIFDPKEYKNCYTGKRFEIGKHDCLSLVVDYYQKELNISLNHYNRNENWYKENPNILLENYEKEGFCKVDEPQKHDILLLGELDKTPGHLAIYLGNNKILHHRREKLSCIEDYGDFYKKITILIVRHKNFVRQ